ncbi:p-type ATPase superfamily [Micromonas commoda]|uniref:P-type ATPase superfamily n=1 Tax=Micromonas commoda (strain RCC299 / NOUM17 / CCMP2709) TaxID=296587 RepID=C1FI14_MICCC|nr:p-type ATPase superfamily [Micromonas commoda]ACO69913.1 p-type ATPase superfamily [Micromonas commoda]|eukprot:XP_002508655.1 p-type ATPase superfamily [Micromonas commoda]
MRRRTRRVTTRASSRATGAGASTRAGTGKKHGGSEGGDEGTAGFGVDAATLRELCEATPGEGRVARIRDLGGLDELARALRSNLRDGLAVTFDDAHARGEDAAVVVVDDRDARIDAFGANVVPSRDVATFTELLLRALDDDTLKILVACGALSLTLELGFASSSNHNPTAWIDGAAILAAVAVVSLVTALNDAQKQAQFERLNACAEGGCRVRARRGGEETAVAIADVLVGDLLLLDAGDVAPADCVIVSTGDCVEVAVDESHLTGESDDVRKTSAGAPVLLGGSKVLEGQCEALAIAVGANSQAGLVTAMVRGQDGKSAPGVGKSAPGDASRRSLSADDKTVLQGKLETLALAIGRVGFYAGAFVALTMSASYTQRLFLGGVFAEGAVGGAVWGAVAGSSPQWAQIAEQYLRFIITGVTVVVVAVPEGLPLAVTLALTFSVRRMLDDNNLVRYLGACETMGGATTILTDKTGTLTRNEMRVRRAWAGGREFRFDELWSGLADAIRCNSTARDTALGTGTAGDGTAGSGTAGSGRFGSRTELALLDFAEVLDPSLPGTRRTFGCPFDGGVERIVPFTSERRRTSSSFDHSFGHFRQYVKGAVLDVLPLCSHALDSDGSGVRAVDVEAVEAVAKAWASAGLRVLLVARKECPPGFDCKRRDLEESESGWEGGLTLVAAVAMEDPLRDEVPASIARCADAGIVVRMVTGDSLATATSVAKKCGILPLDYHHPSSFDSGYEDVDDGVGFEDGGVAMDGETFRERITDPASGEISQTRFDAVWPNLRVLARSSPSDKFALVTGIKASRRSRRREVVAVTGDGTNDAPALRAADVGFAMGVAGTAIARDASDILLLDDDFSSAVAAVKWGRNVYVSVQKFLQFQLTVNVSAVTTACVCALCVGESPLTAVQMLWLNLMMDSLAGLALATDYPGEDLLSKPPISSDEPIVSHRMRWNIAAQAGYQLAAMGTLVWFGDAIFDVPSARGAIDPEPWNRWDFAGAADYFDLIDAASRVSRDAPTVHYTLVFNAFVLMQLANQVNCRAVDGRYDVLAGVTGNRIFCAIFCAEIAMQVAIVQLGGEVFHTRPLDGGQWGACVGIALGSLPLRAGVTWWLNRRETREA